MQSYQLVQAINNQKHHTKGKGARAKRQQNWKHIHMEQFKTVSNDNDDYDEQAKVICILTKRGALKHFFKSYYFRFFPFRVVDDDDDDDDKRSQGIFVRMKVRKRSFGRDFLPCLASIISLCYCLGKVDIFFFITCMRYTFYRKACINVFSSLAL